MIEDHKFLNIDGEEFVHVKSREFTPISVYKGTHGFLRIGPQDVVERELNFQTYLLQQGFPVTLITGKGNIGDLYYFIEESLGDYNLEAIFSHDTEKEGKISNKHFNQLINVVKIYAEAQLRTSTECSTKERFTKQLLRDNIIITELPLLADKTARAVQKALSTLSEFPTVLTHGDFHPANIFFSGVIDLESFAYAPMGYDLLTAIYTTFIMYTPDQAHESRRKYTFTKEQRNQYLDQIDQIFVANRLPILSEYKDSFIVLRSIWATVMLHRWPVTQQLRYGLYTNVLNAYLDGKDIENLVVNY